MGFQNTDQGYVDRSKAAQIVMHLFLKRRLFLVLSSVSLVLVVLIALFCYLPKHHECNLELEAAENYLASAVLSGEHKNHVHRMVRESWHAIKKLWSTTPDSQGQVSSNKPRYRV